MPRTLALALLLTSAALASPSTAAAAFNARGSVEQVPRAPARPSRLILPVVPGLDAPTALPPCRALRGQPCRPSVG